MDLRDLRISEASEVVRVGFSVWRYSERSRKGSAEDVEDLDWRI